MRRRNAALLSIVALCVLLPMVAHAQAAPKGKRIVQPFDYHGVTLEDGPLKMQFDQVRDDYLRIPNDDLLKGFRQRAGLPAPGADLGGWYSSDTFHVFGQILSGLARMYAATGDPACRDKALALLHGWAACIAPDGFFFYSNKPNAPHYIYDKMVGGLTDLYHYCGSTEAIDCLHRITGWAEKHLDRTRPYGGDPNEWYTLSENLYRAYLFTGATQYRDFAKVWEYTEYWDDYARGRSIFAPRENGPTIGGYHAYSHVNTLGGAGAAFLVSGEQHYLDTLTHAYDFLQNEECFATGGYGPNESLLPREGLLRLLGETSNTFETQCGSWAAFKMSKYLISCTGDARYGDWVERLVINGIGASIPMSADGRVFYYSDYNSNGATKRNIDAGWTCCTGTRPEAIADYHDLIYFHDADSLYVNLYTPSTVKWNHSADPVTVTQTTRFPVEDTTEFAISAARPANFAIRLRVPGWLASPMSVQVDGKEVAASPDAQHWITIRRTWRSGDRLTVRLPMQFTASHLDPSRAYPVAILHGPVVMAFRSGHPLPAGDPDLARLDSAFTATAGDALNYHLAADPAVLVRPYYAFKEGEPYYLYLDPAAADRISHTAVTFRPAWSHGGAFDFTNIVGATAEASFTGTGVRWIGSRFDDGGVAEVRIDGAVVAHVDQYGPGRDLPFDWTVTGLSPGKHAIKITVLPDRAPGSKDRFLNVGGFEVLH